MAINNNQFEKLKSLLEGDSQNISKAKEAFTKLEQIKKDFDSLTPAKVASVKIIDINGKEFTVSTTVLNLNNIVNKIKDELEIEYNKIFIVISNLLVKKTNGNTNGNHTIAVK